MSENKGIGGVEQLLIAMSAICTLLECAIADYGDRPSLIGVYAIASELQCHARAVYEVFITCKDGKSDNRRLKLKEEIDELNELLANAEAQMFTNELVDKCKKMPDAGESKGDDGE